MNWTIFYLVTLAALVIAIVAFLFSGKTKPEGVVPKEDLDRVKAQWANHDALVLIQYLIANLHPSQARIWPRKELERYRDALPHIDFGGGALGEHTPDIEGIQFAITSHLKEIDEFDGWRRGERPQPGGYRVSEETLKKNLQLQEEKAKQEQAEVDALTKVLRETGRLASADTKR